MPQSPWTKLPGPKEAGVLTDADIQALSPPAKSGELSDLLRETGYEYGDDPRQPRKGGQVMRFDGDWKKTKSGWKLLKKNIRYEDR